MALFFDELDEIEATHGVVVAACKSSPTASWPDFEDAETDTTTTSAGMSSPIARADDGEHRVADRGLSEPAEEIQVDPRATMLSTQQARQIQVHLVREYASAEFQERLRRAHRRAGDDPDLQAVACEQVGLEAQLRVATHFGYAPTPSTVELIASAFLVYGEADAEVAHRSAVLRWLLSPAVQLSVPIPRGPARCVVYATAVVRRANGELVCQSEVHLDNNIRALKENVFLVTQSAWHSQKLFVGETELFDQVVLSSVMPVAGTVTFRLELRRREVVPWLQELKRGMGVLKEIPPHLMSDPEFILPAVQFQAEVLALADPALRADRAFLMRIVPHCGQALQFLAAELRADRKLVLAAVRHDGWALEFADPELQGDREIVSAAIQQDAEAVQFASSELRSDAEVVLLATRSDPSIVVKVLPELQRDPEAVVRAVKQDWRLLKLVTPEMQAQRDVVMAAVRQSGFALQHAAPERRADRDIVLTAVQNNGDTLRFAAPVLWRDPEILLAAVRQSGTALSLAPPEAQDLEICTRAVRQDRRALVFVAHHLRGAVARGLGIDPATEGNPWLEYGEAAKGRPPGAATAPPPPSPSEAPGLERHFLALGLPDTASKEEIRRRFHQLALQYHPDKYVGDAALGKQLFQRARSAYEALQAAFDL